MFLFVQATRKNIKSAGPGQIRGLDWPAVFISHGGHKWMSRKKLLERESRSDIYRVFSLHPTTLNSRPF